MHFTKSIRSITSILFKLFPGARYFSWITLNYSVSNFNKHVFTTIQSDKNIETFEQAVHRLNLTQEDLKSRYRVLKKFSWYWLGCCLVILSYNLYLLAQQSWLGFFSSAVLISITFCQFFRYHFWAFQIQQKKLGCTFQEWYQHYFNSF